MIEDRCYERGVMTSKRAAVLEIGFLNLCRGNLDGIHGEPAVRCALEAWGYHRKDWHRRHDQTFRGAALPWVNRAAFLREMAGRLSAVISALPCGAHPTKMPYRGVFHGSAEYVARKLVLLRERARFGYIHPSTESAVMRWCDHRPERPFVYADGVIIIPKNPSATAGILRAAVEFDRDSWRWS